MIFTLRLTGEKLDHQQCFGAIRSLNSCWRFTYLSDAAADFIFRLDGDDIYIRVFDSMMMTSILLEKARFCRLLIRYAQIHGPHANFMSFLRLMRHIASAGVLMWHATLAILKGALRFCFCFWRYVNIELQKRFIILI